MLHLRLVSSYSLQSACSISAKGDVNTQGKQFSTTESLARGGVVIAGISQFHKTDADTIFQALIGSKTDLVWLFLDAAVAITVVCFVISLAGKRGQERGRFFGEIAGLTLIFAILPPLVGFSITCLIHSMRHFATMKAMLADSNFQTANNENNGSVFRNVLGCGTGCTRSAI